MLRKVLIGCLMALSMGCGSSTSSTPGGTGEPKSILILGDSLTEGKGVQKNQAYPALLQNKINELGWNFKVINAGVSGDTSADGLNRLPSYLDQNISVFVLALGANDALQKRDLKKMENNLQTILTQVKERNPQVKTIVMGVKFGLIYSMFFPKTFKKIFGNLAEKNDAIFIPNLLDGVVGKPEYNIADKIHPNVQGHQRISETVWEELKPVLERQ